MLCDGILLFALQVMNYVSKYKIKVVDKQKTKKQRNPDNKQKTKNNYNNDDDSINDNGDINNKFKRKQNIRTISNQYFTKCPT